MNAHRGEIGVCYSDEHLAYEGVANENRQHQTVCHSQKEWARDDEGGGINEVHINSLEGLWTESRNFLRRFKGVGKHLIHLYINMFEWMYNLKKVSAQFIQALVLGQSGTCAKSFLCFLFKRPRYTCPNCFCPIRQPTNRNRLEHLRLSRIQRPLNCRFQCGPFFAGE